jgi:hypothetical protein
MSELLAFNLGDVFKVGDKPINQINEYNSLGAFISSVLPNVYLIAGLILFFLIIFSGYGLLSAGGDQEKLKQSSKALTAAITGFLIIFASYWMIQIIEVLTGINIF